MNTNTKDNRIVIKISVTSIILLLIIAAAFVYNKAVAEEELSVTEIEHKLQAESDIVTESDNIKISVTYRAVKKLGIELPFTENKEKISCKGKVKGGYDLSKVDVKKDEDQKIIKIRMPKMKIISKEIDKESIEHESLKSALFHWKDMDYTITLMDDLEKELVKQAKKNGEFEEKALENAEKVLGGLIKKIDGSGEYKVVCV